MREKPDCPRCYHPKVLYLGIVYKTIKKRGRQFREKHHVYRCLNPECNWKFWRIEEGKMNGEN